MAARRASIIHFGRCLYAPCDALQPTGRFCWLTNFQKQVEILKIICIFIRFLYWLHWKFKVQVYSSFNFNCVFVFTVILYFNSSSVAQGTSMLLTTATNTNSTHSHYAEEIIFFTLTLGLDDAWYFSSCRLKCKTRWKSWQLEWCHIAKVPWCRFSRPPRLHQLSPKQLPNTSKSFICKSSVCQTLREKLMPATKKREEWTKDSKLSAEEKKKRMGEKGCTRKEVTTSRQCTCMHLKTTMFRARFNFSQIAKHNL